MAADLLFFSALSQISAIARLQIRAAMERERALASLRQVCPTEESYRSVLKFVAEAHRREIAEAVESPQPARPVVEIIEEVTLRIARGEDVAALAAWGG